MKEKRICSSNFFERILEVNQSCRDETIIRKAYLEKVKKYHPDSPRQDNKNDYQKFNQVQEAYEALTVNLHFFRRLSVLR